MPPVAGGTDYLFVAGGDDLFKVSDYDYDSGDYAGAAELATLGLKIQPTRESLADLKRDAEAKLPAESK